MIYLKSILNILRLFKKTLNVSLCYFIFRLAKYRKFSKLVIGSGGTYEKGWIPSEKNFLNLLNQKHWNKYFKKNSLDAILAEHVFEHLSISELKSAIKIMHYYLKPGGYIRVAVPDGYHPSKSYINHVKPNLNENSHGHKVLYNHKIITKLFLDAGFKVSMLEYFDENHKFHYNKWNIHQGNIRRSSMNDKRNVEGKLAYTSVIFDAFKDK